MQRISVALLVALAFAWNVTVFAQDEGARKGDQLQLLSYIAWWSHDDAGYHPAVSFKFENTSSEDLSGSELRFQARFTDLRNNYLSVKRMDVKVPNLEPGHQLYETMTCRDPYELPISIDSWPQIECKVLYKVNDDQEPHQLLIARVDEVTMTNEEAVEKMLRAQPITRTPRGKRKRKVDTTAEPPLAATALPLSGSMPDKKDNPAPKSTGVKSKGVEKSSEGGVHVRTSAGLGDDFFDFEQSFGRPITFDSTSGRYTWAKYSRPNDFDVYVGARQPSSKADMVIVVVSNSKPIAEPTLIQIGKDFAGKMKGQSLNGPSRTVKYLPTGRVQVSALSASAYHFSIYATTDASEVNHYCLILSRLPGNFESIVADQARRSKLVHFLTPLFGEND